MDIIIIISCISGYDYGIAKLRNIRYNRGMKLDMYFMGYHISIKPIERENIPRKHGKIKATIIEPFTSKEKEETIKQFFE